MRAQTGRPNFVEGGGARVRAVREDFLEKVEFELGVDRWLALSRQGQYLDCFLLILMDQLGLVGKRERRAPEKHGILEPEWTSECII